MSPEEILAIYKQHGIGGKQVSDGPAQADGGAQTGSGMKNLPRAPKAESAVVWRLHSDKTLEPIEVSLGITDHAYTEFTAVLNGQLNEGDSVIIRSVAPASAVPGGIRR
jgi:hypothetical protein